MSLAILNLTGTIKLPQLSTTPTTKQFHKKRKLRISIRNGDNVQGQKKYEAFACLSFGPC